MYTASSSPYGQVSSLPTAGEAGSYYTSPGVQTYASPGGIYSGGTLAGGYGGITSAYSGGTLAGAYGGSSGLAAYSGGTTTGLAAYSPSTSALPGAAYTPGTISGTYSPSSAAYTGAVTGTAYTPGTMSGMAYTPGSLAGGVTTVAGGNYSSAPAYGTGTGSFSIAPANTYGGYYSAGTYSAPEGAASSASFTVPPMGQDLYGGTSGLPTTPSMLLNPSLNPLQSAPSMIAYNSQLPNTFGGGPPYSSAMDGPFKFYATPPGKLPDAEPRPSKMDDGSQTGGSLRAGVTSSEPLREDIESKKLGKKSKKKKSSGCC